MRDYMQIAFEEAKKGVESGDGGPFGAVVVKDGEIIATAHNEVLRRNDPTAHAEVLAIRRACAKLGHFELKGCELYATGEPCPMCFSAVFWARLERVFFCNTKQEAASIGFDDEFITEVLLRKRHSPIPFIHKPQDSCKALLRLWMDKEDKVMY